MRFFIHYIKKSKEERVFQEKSVSLHSILFIHYIKESNLEIKRDIHLNRIIARKGNGMIKVITGIRRCGKSYLLFTLFTNYLKSQGVDEQHIIKVDLEDRRNVFLRNPD